MLPSPCLISRALPRYAGALPLLPPLPLLPSITVSATLCLCICYHLSRLLSPSPPLPLTLSGYALHRESWHSDCTVLADEARSEGGQEMGQMGQQEQQHMEHVQQQIDLVRTRLFELHSASSSPLPASASAEDNGKQIEAAEQAAHTNAERAAADATELIQLREEKVADVSRIREAEQQIAKLQQQLSEPSPRSILCCSALCWLAVGSCAVCG